MSCFFICFIIFSYVYVAKLCANCQLPCFSLHKCSAMGFFESCVVNKTNCRIKTTATNGGFCNYLGLFWDHYKLITVAKLTSFCSATELNYVLK